LGLKKHHNRDFQQTAAVPAEVIHQAVEAANAEGGPVTKAEIRRAGDADAAEAARLLEQVMIQGMLSVLPDLPANGLAVAHVGKSWADKG
jgi:hypothetical protein